jgi:division protein CdvB (Snf7/Vps24/ESCRT-III family)
MKNKKDHLKKIIEEVIEENLEEVQSLLEENPIEQDPLDNEVNNNIMQGLTQYGKMQASLNIKPFHIDGGASRRTAIEYLKSQIK